MLTRLFLRAMSLGAKFVLTVAIARMLGFAAVAEYGLAVAASVIASKAFGLGFSAELNRRLSVVDPSAAIRSARRLRGIYCLAYLMVALVSFAAWRMGWLEPAGVGSTVQLFEVVLVAVAEHYAFEANSYLFSLHRAQAASFALFIRTGVWAALAVAGLLTGLVSDIQTVLWLWIGANLCVIVYAWFVIEAVARATANSNRTAASLRGVFASGATFYAATIALSLSQYAERFIAAPYLSGESLGRYVFTWSVANAVQTVTYAVLIVTAGPRLAKAAANAPHRFRHVLQRSLWSVVAVSIAMSCLIAALCRPLFMLAHQPMDKPGLTTLLILLGSFVLRSVSDLLWAAAIATMQGRRIAWGTAALVPISAFSTWWLVVHLALIGVALAHFVASVLIVSWFAWVVRSGSVDVCAHEAREAGDKNAA